jgi:tetratricopeptide (TPR) repeat protein
MSNTKSTNRTPSLINAEWSSEHAAEATLTAATTSVARPQHNCNMSARASNTRQTFHATSLSFFYNDNEEEDFIINTHHTEEHLPRSQSQPNLMRTNLTKPTRGNLTRNPSTGSLVSIEVLQELMMERSTRSIGSYGSSGYKSSRASKCSNCSSSRQGSARRRSISSEGDAQEDMDERGWRARVLQLKQLAIMEGLFDKRESLRWNPFSSITSGSRSNDAARDLLVETKPMLPRPKRRSLPGSLRSDDSDTECSDDRHLGPFGKCSQKAQRESEEPAFARQDGDNISNLSPQSDGLIYKQRKLEVSTHRRASDPPTSPTLSIRTTISNISHGDLVRTTISNISHGDLVGDVHTFALKGTVGSDSSNNVCDVEKSPLTNGAELTATPELLPMDEPQLLSPNRETKTHLPYPSGNEDRQQQQQSPKNAESAYLKNLFLGLYNEQNAQNVDDENEPADMTIVNDFAKAARRKSFQKSLSESFQSGDFDYQLSDALSSGAMSAEDDAHAIDLHQQEIDVDIEKKRSSQLYSRRESFEIYKQRNSARMRRRPTVESETGKSAVSSLDSLASPIDRARAGNAALTSPPCHLTRSQFTNAAVAAMPPLKKENSIGSLSSLGTESIDRDGIKAEDFLRKHSNEHTACAKQSPQSKPNINGSRQEREERSGWVSGDQSSITMGTFFTQLQKTLTHGYQESENRSNAREVLDSSRRRSGASSITLGTFLNELKLVDKDSSSAQHDSDDDQDSGLNEMCDFDSGLASFLIAMRLGHFDCHDEVIGNTNTDEDDDRHLAAKAFMGLGFAAQLTGENESALDWYMKSLHLWESEIGAEHPSLACLHYTIGIVLSQERNDLEASVHFNNAIDLLKANKTVDETIRASSLFTEGMIFSVLGEAERAIVCLKRGLLLCQTPDLNHATVMYEMGTLLAQQGELEHAINCYKHSLTIRERTIDNTFILMQTHYSLGVTLAEDDSPISKDYAMIHLQEALKLCGEAHIQSPTIIHAIGVLSEKRGDYHAASNWFYQELNAIKILFGEGECIHSRFNTLCVLRLTQPMHSLDDERVGMCSSDVGSSFYRIGKYDLANTLFEQALRILLHVTEDEQSLEVADLLYKIASCHESLCEYTEGRIVIHIGVT